MDCGYCSYKSCNSNKTIYRMIHTGTLQCLPHLSVISSFGSVESTTGFGHRWCPSRKNRTLERVPDGRQCHSLRHTTNSSSVSTAILQLGHVQHPRQATRGGGKVSSRHLQLPIQYWISHLGKNKKTTAIWQSNSTANP